MSSTFNLRNSFPRKAAALSAILRRFRKSERRKSSFRRLWAFEKIEDGRVLRRRLGRGQTTLLLKPI